MNSSKIQEKPGSQYNLSLKKGREHNINGYVHSHSNASNATNSSLLKRRIIFSILAVCITLSKTSVATTETEISNLTPPHSDLGMWILIFHIYDRNSVCWFFPSQININYISLLTLSESANCTKAAVEEFPSDFLNANQRQNGGIIIHFLIGIKI